jgi:hypothetical protein
VRARTARLCVLPRAARRAGALRPPGVAAPWSIVRLCVYSRRQLYYPYHRAPEPMRKLEAIPAGASAFALEGVSMKSVLKGAAIATLVSIGFSLSACGSETANANAKAEPDTADLTAAALDKDMAAHPHPTEPAPTGTASPTPPAH